MPRIAVLASHPIQYQAPLFRELARRRRVDLRVFFCWNPVASSRPDPGFQRDVTWDVPLLDGYESVFLENRSKDPGPSHRLGLVNPGAVEAIVRWRPDAVLVHGYAHWTERHVLPGLADRRIPVVFRGESNLLPRRPIWLRTAKQILLRRLFRHVAAFAAIGSLNQQYFKHYGIPDDRIFLSPYSVDNHHFTSRRIEAEAQASAWRSELGVAPDVPVVVFAAKFIPVKGCDVLIEAFSRVRHPAALVLVGAGPLEVYLRELAARLAPGRVFFPGFVNQSRMPAAYALGDLFVLPSRLEPWGLVVNEAMCMGKPIVVSDQVGCGPDLVSSLNGWVFRAGDVGQLTAVLDEALQSSELLRVKGAQSDTRISTWGVPETAQGLLEAVDFAAARRRPH